MMWPSQNENKITQDGAVLVMHVSNLCRASDEK